MNASAYHHTFLMAHAYVQASISVIPIRVDGSKAPAISSWKRYQSTHPTIHELKPWFIKNHGIGLICGSISGMLEVLDFDEDAEETFDHWWSQLDPAIQEKLTVISTGGDGFHVPYRTEQVCGNEKIAMRTDGKVLIESRGEGGYIIGVGSPKEVHRSLKPYEQIQGSPLPQLPFLNLSERKALWDAAFSLDQRCREEVIYSYRSRLSRSIEINYTADTPWDRFDREASWESILRPAGWTSSDGIHWTRPGKTNGTSAKVVNASNGCEVLTVFSTNAQELAPAQGSHRTLGKFQTYTILHHRGDRSAAARQVLSFLNIRE